MKPSQFKLTVGTVGWILLLMCATLRAGMISPDGRFVVYAVPAYDEAADLYHEVFLNETDGLSSSKLARLAGGWNQINWIGKDRIVISQFAMVDHFVVLDTTGKRLPDIVLPSGCQPLYMSLSPDGEKVTFTGRRKVGGSEQRGLFVCDLKQSQVRLLLEKSIKTLAAWSPHSSRLAVGTGPGYTKNYPLQIVDITTGEVDDTGTLGVGASWSPDGKLIACTTDVQRGGSWYAGVPTDGKLGLFDVEQRKMQIVEGTDGAIQPAWSQTGNYVAYVTGENLGIVPRNGSKPTKVQPLGESLKEVQMAWAGDNVLFIRTKTRLARFDVPAGTVTKVAEWMTPRPPEITPKDFKMLELPRVIVRYARFDRIHAEALGKILEEALKVYESLGFKMPAEVTLEAEIDPSRTQLWTDGESQMFLHLKSKEVLAPAPRTDVYNIYGMCHELGHIAMYRNMKNLMGLPAGVGEGWAHYAGSVVVTEVAARLGKSIWPEYYDVAEVEGMGRLKRESQTAKPWDKLDANARAALVFYRMETEFGRTKLASAMTAALAERPSGKDLMPLMLAKLRKTTANSTAADWIPESVLVPHVEWTTKERQSDEGFFADQKNEPDTTGLWLGYDDGTMEDKRSMSGSAETVLFRLPEGSWQLDGIKLFSSRYGADAPPKEDISIYICNQAFELLQEVKIPYSRFEKGDEKWHSISFDPVNVPKTFYLGMDFHATATKGVYVGMDKGVKRSHSRIAMPYAYVGDMRETADWMIRPHLRLKK